ncbi:MAG: hypothetical protein ACE3JK_01705 [Sporolactobacillus sp.]
MDPELGLGRVAAMHGIRTESAAAAAAINWGAALQLNADDPNKIEPFAGGKPFYGIAIESMFGEFRETDVSEFPTANYVAQDAVSILRRGRIWVLVLEDVIRGQGAKVDNVTANFRPETTVVAEVSTVVGVFKNNALANHLAEVEINLP